MRVIFLSFFAVAFLASCVTQTHFYEKAGVEMDAVRRDMGLCGANYNSSGGATVKPSNSEQLRDCMVGKGYHHTVVTGIPNFVFAKQGASAAEHRTTYGLCGASFDAGEIQGAGKDVESFAKCMQKSGFMLIPLTENTTVDWVQQENQQEREVKTDLTDCGAISRRGRPVVRVGNSVRLGMCMEEKGYSLRTFSNRFATGYKVVDD